MFRKLVSAYVLIATLGYLFYNWRKCIPTEEYHFHNLYVIGKSVVSCGWTGSGSYVDVKIFDTPAHWAMEGGEIMPEPGEEAAWLAAHQHRPEAPVA